MAAPERLSAKARAAIEAHEKDRLVVSAISVWEIALKHSLGKLDLGMEVHHWLRSASSYPGIRIEPLGFEQALASTRLPGELHRDPADRFIVALARSLGRPLVTRDARLLAYEGVETIW